MPNKSYAYLLNEKPNNLVFLKINNTEFNETVITLTYQNGSILEVEDCLLINRNDALFYMTKNQKVCLRI